MVIKWTRGGASTGASDTVPGTLKATGVPVAVKTGASPGVNVVDNGKPSGPTATATGGGEPGGGGGGGLPGTTTAGGGGGGGGGAALAAAFGWAVGARGSALTKASARAVGTRGSGPRRAASSPRSAAAGS